MHALLQGLLAQGFVRLSMDDPMTYRDKAGESHRTYQRGPVRLAVAVQSSLCTMGNGAVLHCVAEPGECWLKALLVEPGHQRQGLGTKVLRELTTLADANQLTLYVEPVALGELTQVHLIGLYGRHGFTAQTKAFRVMVRVPEA